MANDNDKVVIEITLDDGSVKQVFGRIKKDAQDLGRDGDKALSKTTNGLVSNLGEAKDELISLGARFALIGGSIAAVGLVVKKAFDFALAGEQLLAVERTFDRFASNAGLSNLRSDLEAATNGLVDIDDILPKATNALLNFEAGAARLPDLLKIAADSAAQFGGTAEDRFDALVTAVETGNTRILRTQGIVLDTDKVFRNYANALGLTAGELSLANRQQAILNAVLEEGAKRAQTSGESVAPLAEAFKRASVAFDDFIEGFQTAFSNSVGPFFTQLLNKVADVVTAINKKTAEQSDRGTTAIADFRAQIMAAEGNVSNLKNKLENLAKPTLANWASVTTAKDLRNSLAAAETKLADLRAQFAEASKGFTIAPVNADQAPATPGQRTSPAPAVSPLTPEQRAAIQARNAEVLAFQTQAFQAEVQLGEQRLARITDEETRKAALEDLFNQQSTLLLNQRETEKEAIRLKFAGSGAIFTEQREMALAAIDEKYKNLSLQREEEYFEKLNEKAKKAADEYNKSIKDGIVRATVAGAESIGRSLQKGAMNWQDFGTSIAVVLGDLAIQIGTAIIAQSSALLAFTLALQSLGPAAAAAGIAAGIGLVIFGSALKASVGAGGGGGEVPTPGGSVGGGIGGTAPETSVPISDQIEAPKPNTEVVVNISGSVYDSDETGMRIVDLINSAFDKQGVVVKRGAVA